MTPIITTQHCRDLLHKRFASPEWALLEEVAPKTGGGTGYADAVAVNLWQSRGHAIHGVEIKVSRSDWLRELKQPAKAESVYQYCDHWWIVAPKGVVKEEELPPTWGLMEARESTLPIIVIAPRLNPKPITLSFFASLLRRGTEGINKLAERMQNNAVAAARADIDARVKREVEYSTKAHRELASQVERLKAETGIDINRYSGPPIHVIKLAQKLEILTGFRGDKEALSMLTDLANDIDRASTILRNAVEKTGLHSDTTQEKAA